MKRFELRTHVKKLRHMNRRVEQLKGYAGTEDALPGDPFRLSIARGEATNFAARIVVYALDDAYAAAQRIYAINICG